VKLAKKGVLWRKKGVFISPFFLPFLYFPKLNLPNQNKMKIFKICELREKNEQFFDKIRKFFSNYAAK